MQLTFPAMNSTYGSNPHSFTRRSDGRRDADSDEVCNAAATSPEWRAVQLYWGVTRFEFRHNHRLFCVNFPLLPRTFETNSRKNTPTWILYASDVIPRPLHSWSHLNGLWISMSVLNLATQQCLSEQCALFLPPKSADAIRNQPARGPHRILTTVFRKAPVSTTHTGPMISPTVLSPFHLEHEDKW